MKRILVIGDQKDNLTTIEAVIGSYMQDCQALTALSGREGTKIAVKEQPDAIILDVSMPGMDGYPVCKRLKTDELTKHIPVVMITAIKTDSKSRIKGFKMGADAFLSKPIDPDELSAQVNVMLRISEAENKLRKDKDALEQCKQAEKAMKDSEEKLRNIFENSTNVFYSHTNEHLITYISPQIKQLIGYTPEEALVNWTNLASDNPINEKGFKLTEKAINSGKSQPQYELELLHKNGQKVWVEVREKPIIQNGKTDSIVGSLTDITERKQAEVELEIHREHLEELVEERTKELKEKNSKLERFNKLFVDREFRIKELRDRVKELEKK